MLIRARFTESVACRTFLGVGASRGIETVGTCIVFRILADGTSRALMSWGHGKLARWTSLALGASYTSKLTIGTTFTHGVTGFGPGAKRTGYALGEASRSAIGRSPTWHTLGASHRSQELSKITERAAGSSSYVAVASRWTFLARASTSYRRNFSRDTGVARCRTYASLKPSRVALCAGRRPCLELIGPAIAKSAVRRPTQRVFASATGGA